MESIILEGPSGSGKTHSLRNIPPEVSCYITPTNKPLSWRGATSWAAHTKVCRSLRDLPTMIKDAFLKEGKKVAIVDDFSHVMNHQILSTDFLAAGQGQNKYARWETFGRDVYAALFGILPELENVKGYLVVINHVGEQEGKAQFKNHGKMLGNTVDPVSYSRVVLHARVIQDAKSVDQKYVFQINDDGVREAKSPPGMFSENPEQLFIPNDMWEVLRAITRYDKPIEKPAETSAT